MAGRLLRIQGRLQREGIVTHVVSSKIEDLSFLLDALGDAQSEDLQINPSQDNADEFKRPTSVLYSESSGQETGASAEAITLAHQRASQAGYVSGARHPREQAKKLFYSRDFH